MLGVTAEETQSLRAVSRHPVSLHEPLGGDGERALEDFLDDPDATNPGQAVDQHLLRERIGEVLRSLTPREREVIELRFGLRDGQPRTLEEVARAYGITRERIRQIEAHGLLKLRQPLRSRAWRSSRRWNRRDNRLEHGKRAGDPNQVRIAGPFRFWRCKRHYCC